MADKYVIQIAKEGGAQTCEKDENGDNKKIGNSYIVASMDTESQINFVCDNDNINLEDIDKKIKNKLKDNENFTKKREEYNQAKCKIILKDVGSHDEGDLYLFSVNKIKLISEKVINKFNDVKNKCYNDILNNKINEKIENLIKEIKNLNGSNLICWDEFCHIEEFYEDDNKNKILKKMNRLYITDENFNKDSDK